MHTRPTSASANATTTAPPRSLGSVIVTVFIYVSVFWVALPAFLLSTGFRLDALWPVGLSGTRLTIFAGWSLLVLGTILLVGGMSQLWTRGHGLPISHLPPIQLVEEGLYRYLRHPIYVGYTLAFAGVALLLESFWCLACSAPLLLAVWVVYTLYFEEPVLVERFGEVYRAYRQQTRLLWPVPRVLHSSRTPSRIVTGLRNRLNGLANRTICYRRGNLILVTYGVFCALGTLFCAQVLAMVLVQHSLPATHIGLFFIGGALTTSLGAWFFWWVGHWHTLIHERWWGLGQIGFVSYGGLLGILLFPIVFSRAFGYPVFMLTDAVIQGLFLGYACGRIGCLTYGCCYGLPTDKPWGITYKNPDAKMIRLGDSRPVARHPTPIYAFLHGVLLFLVLNAMAWASIPAGLMTAVGLMLAGLGRVFTESYRDRERPFFGRLTYGHLGSGVTFLAGWLLLFMLSPVIEAHAPVSLTATSFVESLSLLPLSLLSALLILIIFGFHWKRLGSWTG